MCRSFSKPVLTALVFALLSGAVYGGGRSEPASPGPAAAPGEAVKPAKITLMASTMIPDPANNNEAVMAAYEKMTGIKLEFIKPAHNEYDQRVDLAFASGDLPDAFEAVPKYATYAANGALWDVTDAFYASPISKRSHIYVADTIKIGGRLYGIPGAHGNGCITYVRQDWLDKLGLKMPANWNEFYNMLVAFRDRDPDGDGIKNTIPFIAAGVVDPMYLRDFYYGENTQPGFFVKNGKIVEGMYDSDFKVGLTRLAQAYQEGLVDQEIVTNATSAARDKFYTGKVGVFTYWAGQWHQNLQSNLAKTVPTAVVAPMPPIQGTVLIDRPAASTLCIPSANRNPLGIFKYLAEVAYDGGEGQMLFIHGVEGVHWKKEGNLYSRLPDAVNPQQLFEKVFVNPTICMYDWDDPIQDQQDLMLSLNLFNKSARPAYTLPSSGDITSIQAELETARQEIVSKIVMGVISVDEGLAQYRRQYDADVQQCLKVMNGLYAQ
jgi:putative aldouronate transport system substrate-binding protein